MAHGEIEHQRVEGGRGDARAHVVDQQVQRLRGQLTRLSHPGESGLVVQFDLTVFPARRCRSFDESHHCP